MPVAVARKIEHRLYTEGLDHLDIEVRPIALTHEQCVRYGLPRTPIKESERRGARFEERFGAGATELDALEAIVPGELERILRREIRRYYDVSLNERIWRASEPLEDEIAEINAATRAEHEPQIAELREEWAEIEKAVASWQERAEDVWQAIANRLAEAAPDLDDIAWPEPAEGDEDEDPLFSSTRGYLQQIDCYKRHQGKPTGRKRRQPQSWRGSR
jgi:hypothetical protein